MNVVELVIQMQVALDLTGVRYRLLNGIVHDDSRPLFEAVKSSTWRVVSNIPRISDFDECDT